MCCGNSILQKGLPFFYLHKIFYTLTDGGNEIKNVLFDLIEYVESYLINNYSVKDIE